MGYNTFPPQPFPPNSVGEKVEIDQLKEELEEVQEDISDINTDIENLNITKANQITIAPTFSAEDEYTVGNIIYYNGLTYRCVNSHTGEWDTNDFILTTIALEIESDIIVDYKLTEQMTGKKWIDGKDIYQKTIDCGVINGTTGIEIAHNIVGIDNVILLHGVLKELSGSFIPLPYATPAGVNVLFRLSIDATKIILEKGSVIPDGGSAYVTVQYTKATT